MLEVVTFNEISKILAVTDRLEIHREKVVIPLRPRTPGRVRRLPDGRLEIVVDAQADFDTWLAGLEAEIAALAA